MHSNAVHFAFLETNHKPTKRRKNTPTNNGQPRLSKNTTGNVHINLILMRVRLITLATEKQKRKSVFCIFALVIQHVMRLRHIAICGLSSSQWFSTLSHKRHNCQKKVTEHKICFNFVYNVCLKRFSF